MRHLVEGLAVIARRVDPDAQSADASFVDGRAADGTTGGDAGTIADANGFEVGTGPANPSPPMNGTFEGGTFTVTWGGGCWELYQGVYYQAMPFDLQTSMPIPIEATLFFTTNCDPAQGTDNLNDTGAKTGSGGRIEWFIHHPQEIHTSAIWSFGNVTSGCVDYSKAPACQ